MILIDIDEVRLKISPEWQEEARKAIEALNDADRSSEDPAERKKATQSNHRQPSLSSNLERFKT